MLEKMRKDKLKTATVIVSIIVFIVGIVMTAVNTGDTYADSSTDYFCPTGGVAFYADDYSTYACLITSVVTINNQSTCQAYLDKYNYSYLDYLSSGGCLYRAPKKVITITYNANGGKNSDGMSTSIHEVEYGKSFSFPEADRMDYMFLGWSTSSTATSATYKSGTTKTALSDTTYYAVWEAACEFSTESKCELEFGTNKCARNTTNGCWEEAYKVTYDAKGGNGAPASQKAPKGVSITISSTVPTRSGFKFKGWDVNQSGTTVKFTSGESLTSKEDVTLYAVWEDNDSGDLSDGTTTEEKYTIKYDANGGSGAPSSQEKTKGKEITLSSTKPTREGYTFVNWNTSKDGKGTSYDAGAKYTKDANLTLYAQWKVNESEGTTTEEKYTIKYDANGGSGAPASHDKSKGKEITLSDKKPTREGYTFVNWNTSKDGKGTTYSAGAKYTKDANLTLYAQWKLIPDNDKTDDEIDDNSKTGDALIYTVYVIGLGALGYSIYYFMRRRNSL